MGYIKAQKSAFGEIKPIHELNPGITTIKVLKHENGHIYGQIGGQKARIAYSPDHILDLEVGETFDIPLNQINLAAYYGAQAIPEGTAYISSKTGKYYYHIFDPRSLRITPKNRLYFSTEEEAVGEGFIPPK